jgi:hypothetical protein
MLDGEVVLDAIVVALGDGLHTLDAVGARHPEFMEICMDDTLARRRNQVHRIQPHIERNVRALQNGASVDGEALLARQAVK